MDFLCFLVINLFGINSVLLSNVKPKKLPLQDNYSQFPTEKHITQWNTHLIRSWYLNLFLSLPSWIMHSLPVSIFWKGKDQKNVKSQKSVHEKDKLSNRFDDHWYPDYVRYSKYNLSAYFWSERLVHDNHNWLLFCFDKSQWLGTPPPPFVFPNLMPNAPFHSHPHELLSRLTPSSSQLCTAQKHSQDPTRAHVWKLAFLSVFFIYLFIRISFLFYFLTSFVCVVWILFVFFPPTGATG